MSAGGGREAAGCRARLPSSDSNVTIMSAGGGREAADAGIRRPIPLQDVLNQLITDSLIG